MHRTELIELIRNGEDSRLEFKRDGIENHVLAKALVAFLNLEGGTVLLGVDDDGSISGTFRDRLVEWVMEVGRVKIEPQIIPLVSWTRAIDPGCDVLAVRVTRGPDKPYACLHGGRKTYYIRAGNTSREASREELQRMYQASGRLQYGLKPVPGADFDAFDYRRLREYLTSLSYDPIPSKIDLDGWETLLRNIELMTHSAAQFVATIDGLLLFGKLRSDTYRSREFVLSAIRGPSPTTRHEPTRICEDPYSHCEPRMEPASSPASLNRRGTSSVATRRLRPNSKVLRGWIGGNTPRA